MDQAPGVMGRQPLALLGFVPIVPYLIAFYLSFRLLHLRSAQFHRWLIGWSAFAIFIILFAIARTRVVLSELSASVPIDWTRLALVSLGSCCLLIFVLALRWTFPNGNQTLWDDMCTDARRLWRLICRL